VGIARHENKFLEVNGGMRKNPAVQSKESRINDAMTVPELLGIRDVKTFLSWKYSKLCMGRNPLNKCHRT